MAQVESQRTKKKERAGRQPPPQIETVPPESKQTITPGAAEQAKIEAQTKEATTAKKGAAEETKKAPVKEATTAHEDKKKELTAA